jgi:hypothetical protein
MAAAMSQPSVSAPAAQPKTCHAIPSASATSAALTVATTSTRTD